MSTKITDTTVWDNSSIYKSIDDPKIASDMEKFVSEIPGLLKEGESLKKIIPKLENATQDEITTSLELAKKMSRDKLRLSIELDTIRTYISCVTSVDAKNSTAKSLDSQLTTIFTRFDKALTPLDVFMMRIDEKSFESFLEDEELNQYEYAIGHARKQAVHLLSTDEETLVSGLSIDGLHAWGKLYDDISGTLICEVDGENLGYATTANLVKQGDRTKREKAFKAVNKSWTVHEESAAAILNAINGWRLENFSARSKKKDYHYLDKSCHQSHITRKTLEALMNATFENRSIGHRALNTMAKAMDLKTLAPWDIMAPAPSKGGKGKSYSFKEAMKIIVDAFNTLSTDMGDFAQMMYEKNWIDARPSENRYPGAYCTDFAKSKEPRVFMTYDGSMGNVLTLAHEIGHAYHSWVMRDMPYVRTHYAMTTAETASIFAETLVRDYLYENSNSDEDKYEIAWQDGESAAIMLCNIPTRFEFEKNLVEARKERTIPPKELKAMMSDAWKTWYGDSLTEYDDMFWASKLHFSISELGFYNYPYLFGYLFSLGIYALKDKMGDDFNELYITILRDTGSMTAEELIRKHIDKNIEEKEFWQGSLDIVDKAVSRFESLV